ncbi:isoprenyl transferase [Trueperella pyogenes]|uniref:isoprenyl transferase n=1 Tax=Trueperella pyogenes TaxID=1661 RepID=UPI00066119CC|nr:isoprenyl transferase [Trueperella pyogenes]
MSQWNVLYDVYEKRLRASLLGRPIPRHVGVILDGNRRWAKSIGFTASQGHRVGAGKITEFLGWAEEVGVEIVTLWMLSTDNLSRQSDELSELLAIISQAVSALSQAGKWHLRIVGDLRLLPEDIANSLRQAAQESPSKSALSVNIAVGYGGRHEIVEAVREVIRDAGQQGESLEELASRLKDSDIAEHLYTGDQPDPDLVIRTSGEQRLSGFMIWQSAHSEFYFCETYWPDFRKIDFLRALRAYAQRERRMGK